MLTVAFYEIMTDKGEYVMNVIKILCALSLLMQLSVLQATWVIVKIDNQSDLSFVQAARHNNVEIASISHTLKNHTTDDNLIHLDAQALFGSSGGCKIVTKNPQGDQIFIAFFGGPRHRVANGRAYNHACEDSRRAAESISSSKIARVFMVQDDVSELIGFAGYDEENQPFALQVIGDNGKYQATLIAQ